MNTLIKIGKTVAMATLILLAIVAGLILAPLAAIATACGMDIDATANDMSNLDTEEAA